MNEKAKKRIASRLPPTSMPVRWADWYEEDVSYLLSEVERLEREVKGYRIGWGGRLKYPGKPLWRGWSGY